MKVSGAGIHIDSYFESFVYLRLWKALLMGDRNKLFLGTVNMSRLIDC